MTVLEVAARLVGAVVALAAAVYATRRARRWPWEKRSDVVGIYALIWFFALCAVVIIVLPAPPGPVVLYPV